MVKQSIVLFINNKKINGIRKKYDSGFNKYKSHISLVSNFNIANQEKLFSHIQNSIKEIKPFDISLMGLRKSAREYYLYLLINDNENIIIKLYRKLNSGILSRFKNKDMPKYIPHVTLGVFDSKKDIDEAMRSIKKEKLSVSLIISNISLLTLNLDNSIKSIKNFKLK
jgi:2'-5' RNA ligase